MQAFTLTRFRKQGLDGLALLDRPLPSVQADHVLVRLKAAALNPADLHIASGEMKMMSPVSPPLVLGVEGAGIIDALGAQVQGWAVGDEVLFYTGLVHSGTMAEYIAVPIQALARKPATWSFEQAAASALALLCANLAWSRASLQSGQHVLVHGSGPVGATAAVLAYGRGAVVDVSASAIDVPYLTRLGVRTVYDYKKQPLSSLPTAHYDVVLDGMGERLFLESLPKLKQGGCIASLKVMTGMDDMLRMGMQPPFIVNWLMPLMFRKYTKAAAQAGVRVCGIATYADGATLDVLVREAQILNYTVRISQVFGLSQVHDAWSLLAQGKPRGKVVVVI